MSACDVFTLGLGLSEPWMLVGQALDLEKQPSKMRLAGISTFSSTTASSEHASLASSAPNTAFGALMYPGLGQAATSLISAGYHDAVEDVPTTVEVGIRGNALYPIVQSLELFLLKSLPAMP